jgi:hypothetical protein
MTQPGFKDRPPPDDHDPQAQARLVISHIRMTITQKEGVQTLAVPATLHKILNSIRDFDNKAVFADVTNQPFTLETFPADKAKFDNSFGTVIKDGRTTQVIVGFTVKSINTFGKIKQAILPILQRNNTFLRPHLSTTWAHLDTITIGHLHLVHPTFADAAELTRKMTHQIQETVARIQGTEEYHDNLQPFLDHEGNFETPEVMFYPGRALGKMGSDAVSSDVIEIYVAREYATALNYLLEASTDNRHRPLAVIPREFKYRQPELYAKLLSAQNDYLETHRNIGLVAIPNDAMYFQKVKDVEGKEWKSLHDALLQAPGIAHVHCSKRVFDLGKWNISTTHDSWENVKAWLDEQLLPLYHSIPQDIRDDYKTYAEFLGPQRLQHRPPLHNTNAQPSAYAQRLETQLLGNATVPRATHHQPPAWKAKRPKLVWTFKEADFPTFKPPTAHKLCDELSTGSNQTNTTTQSMTTISTSDESIKKLQAQWKKQKEAMESNIQAQLTTMDTSVKTIMHRMEDLETKIETKIDTKFATFQETLTTVITEKLRTTNLVAQVAEVIGGENSPFVTSASLAATMAEFFNKVNNRLDTISIPNPETDRRRKKRQSESDDSDYGDAMEEETPDSADDAKKAVGRKE